MLASAPPGGASGRPMCFGKPATIVGTDHRDVINGTPRKDVIASARRRDVIEAQNNRLRHGKDVACGGAGNDKIVGNNERNVLIGGPGNDRIKGGPGDDLDRRRQRKPGWQQSGETGRDTLNGTGGDDFVVGDNYALGDATGAKSRQGHRRTRRTPIS